MGSFHMLRVEKFRVILASDSDRKFSSSQDKPGLGSPVRQQCQPFCNELRDGSESGFMRQSNWPDFYCNAVLIT